jgi:hypothetical protein
MKLGFNISKDSILLFLSALLIILLAVFLAWLDIPLKQKKEITYYFFTVFAFFVILDLLLPFRSSYKWFGFETKFPLRLGAVINGLLVVFLMIIFKAQIEDALIIQNASILICELFLWLGIMHAIGRFIRRRRKQSEDAGR